MQSRLQWSSVQRPRQFARRKVGAVARMVVRNCLIELQRVGLRNGRGWRFVRWESVHCYFVVENHQSLVVDQ